jgi:hypothetical protein
MTIPPTWEKVVFAPSGSSPTPCLSLPELRPTIVTRGLAEGGVQSDKHVSDRPELSTAEFQCVMLGLLRVEMNMVVEAENWGLIDTQEDFGGNGVEMALKSERVLASWNEI